MSLNINQVLEIAVAENQSEEVIRFLLKYINKEKFPLISEIYHKACINNNIQTVLLLLDKNIALPSLNHKDNLDNTPLYYLLKKNNKSGLSSVINTMLLKGLNINNVNEYNLKYDDI